MSIIRIIDGRESEEEQTIFVTTVNNVLDLVNESRHIGNVIFIVRFDYR